MRRPCPRVAYRRSLGQINLRCRLALASHRTGPPRDAHDQAAAVGAPAPSVPPIARNGSSAAERIRPASVADNATTTTVP